jgi:hypothetical protein
VQFNSTKEIAEITTIVLPSFHSFVRQVKADRPKQLSVSFIHSFFERICSSGLHGTVVVCCAYSFDKAWACFCLLGRMVELVPVYFGGTQLLRVFATIG